MNYIEEAEKLKKWVKSQAWLSEMDKVRYLSWAEDFEQKSKL